MLDEKSLDILKILQKKARIPNVDISREVGLAPSAVLERIRKLEKQGYIDGYEVRLNPEKFGKSLISFIKIYLTGGVDSNTLANDLSQISVIQEIHFITGEDCFFVKIRVGNQQELYSILQEKIMTLDGVKSTSTSTVLTTFKETARIPICLDQ